MADAEQLGWDERFARQRWPDDAEATYTARVVSHDREGYNLLDLSATERRGRVGGRLRHDAQSRIDLPAVGDWVRVEPDPGGIDTIMGVYERKSALVRQMPGKTTEPQLIAANLDTVFIVTSMTQEFEPRRLERYLLAVREADARPVIVLNKADLTDEPAGFIEAAEAVADGAPVVALSALEGSIAPLTRWLGCGQTVALVGSSGVGKSTIINELLGQQVQATAEVRETDFAGRHTTTARELLVMPGGRGLLIDTPGIRELQLWAGEAEAEDAFEDVAVIAEACRFRDCRHGPEPGCAVREAVEAGELTEERLAAWQKLQAELNAHRHRQVVADRIARRGRKPDE